MLESTLLHHSRCGPRGDGDVVGISWKAPTRSHPSPSLVVTCAHQVIVYKPGEERRTHQWSFKPSAATVLSHGAVFLPAASRYVGVQQGCTLVSWRETEQDVKRPLSSQAAGPVHAVHACPQLGDYFVAVLASGGVSVYQGGLQRVAHCDAAATSTAMNGISSNGPAGPATNTRAKIVWSGVRGNKVLVLENIGAAYDRITTFALTVKGVVGVSRSSRPTNTGDGRAAPGAGATVALVSSHVLTKPSLGGGEDERAAEGEGKTGSACSACSATFLGHESVGGGAGRSVISVAWRTSRGPVWTRVVVGADGATEELSRLAGGRTAAAAPNHGGSESNGNGVVSASPSNGHGARPKKSRTGRSVTGVGPVTPGGKRRVDAGWGFVPAIAAADGGRLLLHSGGGMSARLEIWNAAYGVLLEGGAAPEAAVNEGGGASSFSSVCEERAVSMKVSGDGALLALAVAGKVHVCPIPIKTAGTLASLLRRKRPHSSSGGVDGGGNLVSARPFPSVDLGRSAPAWKLLEETGSTEAETWEAAVVTPFREAEAKVIGSLQDATRRKDGEAFERVLQEHLQHEQQRASGVGVGVGVGESVGGEVDGSGAASCGEVGRKKRRRRGISDGDCSAGIVAAAVELCLANPDANLWGALAVLVRSGAVSARHHRGLVASIIEHASPELLEEVMLHVPDLPEADAVKILRHFVSQAATLAVESKRPKAIEGGATVASALSSAVMPVPEVPNKSSGGAPPAKRARNSNGGVAVSAGSASPSTEVAPGDDANGGVVLSVLSPSMKHVDRASKNTGGIDKKTAVMKSCENGESTTTKVSVGGEGDGGGGGHDGGHHVSNGVTKTLTSSGASLSNGHHPATPDEGGTSSDGGFSDGGAQKTTNGVSKAASEKSESESKNKRKSITGQREETQATATATAAAAAARAERGVRVALTLPHNEAFLRSALAGMSHREVVVVLKVLTRLLAEGKTLETGGGTKSRGKHATIAALGLPPIRTDSVVGWACAVLDSHFTRLAIGGSADAELVGALRALKKATRREAECCELMCQVRSLVDEMGRRQAAAGAEKNRRHTPRDLFTLRVLTF